ncbi:cache domain-containing sensor histidine kinase [Paenibacillus methanolicus]|uniref:Two-component system sensor histidine kinase YesM n=1 Tax=Paenibacillus methanolicus TaxID=582686 RepID=A0A5S5CL92_9BACL|nr:sensor histidine kinase [Paenibacillus methanolicus]TYP79148.1 two-component system sensor histidine kinase YesM [Paenibacillus methanolicus]
MRLLRFTNGISVTTKFVAIFVSIVTLSLVVTGFMLYVQATRSTTQQAQTVMEQNLLQIKDSIEEKIQLVENLSQIIAFDTRIQTFLGSVFMNEPFQLEDYRSTISPILENIMRQNNAIHSARIYMANETIPELYDGFYHLSRIAGDDAYKPFMGDRKTQTAWSGLRKEQAMTARFGVAGNEDVFAYDRKIFSSRYVNMAALLEIEVKRDMLFEALKEPVSEGFGRVLVMDGKGKIVSNFEPALYMKNIAEIGIGALPEGREWNEIRKVEGERAIVISQPLDDIGLRLVGVYPIRHFNDKVTSSLKMMVLILFIALLSLSLLVYFVTTKLLSRMKLLLRAMKKVREGSLDVSVPVASNDEFSQMAISFNHMTGRIHELVEKVYKIEIMEKEAELRALESQINPHFLYNTLATISWAARKAEAPEITQISNALAKFYRLVLNKGSSESTIGGEIEMVKAYLQIQKFRFEDRFDVVYELDERTFGCRAAKNIVQPLVENALAHGIEPKREHGTLIIKTGFEAGRPFIQVIDDGVGMSAERLAAINGDMFESSGSGYAIRNIRQRLAAYYGDRHRFELYSRQGIGTVVTVRMPQEEEGDANAADADRGR